MRVPPAICIAGLVALLPVLPAPAADTPGRDEPVTRLEPMVVRPSYATIGVGFVLSGKNLFAPADDPILEARVLTVQSTGEEQADPLQPQDVLVAVNGQELRGLTLRQIAALVQEARRQPRMLWRVRRGLAVFEVAQSGTWEPPLPGLDR